MTSGLHSLIAREAGAGGDGVRRGRTRGPRRRPPFVAHIATFWSPDTAAGHIEDCRTGRDGDGEWKPWEELDEGQRWSFWWEALEGYAAFAPTTEVAVP